MQILGMTAIIILAKGGARFLLPTTKNAGFRILGQTQSEAVKVSIQQQDDHSRN
jgi:hypothetical protein